MKLFSDLSSNISNKYHSELRKSAGNTFSNFLVSEAASYLAKV